MAAEPPPRRPVVCSPEGMSLAQNIDRRQCKRVVPMKILALGLSRTGTASLRQALLDLGYSDVYHYASVLNENPRDAEMWVEALKAKYLHQGEPFTRQDWDQLLGHCMAITDSPCAMFYRELLATYPDTKVILTLRDSPEQWWNSQMQTIVPFFDKILLPPPSWMGWVCGLFLPDSGAVGEMGSLLGRNAPMYKALLRDHREGTREAVEFYREYEEEVRRIVPRERLLVMNVREGWRPLCEFLGHDVPAWDFPKVNTVDEFNSNTDTMISMVGKTMLLNMAKTLVPVVSIAVVGVAWWIRSRP